MSVAQRRLDRAHGVVGKVRMANQVELAPGEVKEVLGRVQLAVSMASQTTTVDALGSFVDGNVTVTPALTRIGQDTEMIVVEVCNHSGQPATLSGNTVVAQLSQAHVMDVDAVERLLPDDEEFIDTFETGHLSSSVAMDLRTFPMESKDDFTRHKLDLGHSKVKHHQIKMKDYIPWKDKTRRLVPSLYDEVRQHLKEMLDLDVIRPPNSPYSSNVVLVRKPNGELRFCLDLRYINENTIRDTFYLPRVDETLDALAGSKIFSTLDLKSGYWQVELEEESKQYTAFTVGRLGFYECNRMPFGLTNAPATFKRLMQEILGDLYLKGVTVYLDDIVVHTATLEEHFRLLREVFQRLREAGLKLNPKKCHFLLEVVKCLGHVVSAEGIECDDSKIEAIRGWPEPTNVKELQRFLGFTGYYRRFIKDYAKIARLLTDLLKGSNPRKGHKKWKAQNVEVPWCWQEEQQDAIKELVTQMISPPVLCYPDFTKPFIVRVDASKQGLGAILCQKQESGEVPMSLMVVET